MPESATVARAQRLITESTGVPFCQCLTAPSCYCAPRGRRLEALGGDILGGCCCWRRGYCRQRSEGRARRGVSRRSWGWGYSADRCCDSKGIVPYHPQDTVNVFSAPTPWGTRHGRDLVSAVEFFFWEFGAISQFHIDFADIIWYCTFAYHITIRMLRAILQFHIHFADIPQVCNNSILHYIFAIITIITSLH